MIIAILADNFGAGHVAARGEAVIAHPGRARIAVESLLSECLSREPVGLRDLAVEELGTSGDECGPLVCAIEDLVYEVAPFPLMIPLSLLIGLQLGKRLAAGELDALVWRERDHDRYKPTRAGVRDQGPAGAETDPWADRKAGHPAGS